MDWSEEEIRAIAAADDMHISPFREDGESYGTPTWIWSVVVEGDLFVRAYNGTRSRWYQAAMEQQAGRILTVGRVIEVVFEPVDGRMQERIDDAYREKYRGSPYLDPMVSARARSATVKVSPRS